MKEGLRQSPFASPAAKTSPIFGYEAGRSGGPTQGTA